MERNSKISIARLSREEAGPRPDKEIRDHIFLIFKVKEIFQTKAPWRSKDGVMSNLPIGLFVGIYFGWEMCTHTGESDIDQIRTQNQANQNDWPKETHTKCHIQVIQTTARCDSLSLSVPMSPHIPFSNNQFTCFTTFCICGNVFFFFAKSKGQGLVIEHWSNGWDSSTLTTMAQPQSLARNQTAEAIWDQFYNSR